MMQSPLVSAIPHIETGGTQDSCSSGPFESIANLASEAPLKQPNLDRNYDGQKAIGTASASLHSDSIVVQQKDLSGRASPLCAPSSVERVEQRTPTFLKTFLYAGTVWFIATVFVVLLQRCTWFSGWGNDLSAAECLFVILMLPVAARFGSTALDIGLNLLGRKNTTRFPSVDLGGHIPDECRTLVIVPVLLNPENCGKMIDRLWSHYQANPSENLCFALLTDFGDCVTATGSQDKKAVDSIIAGIQALNQKLGSGKAKRFFVFHRDRCWDPINRVWTAHHRKVGKIVALNRWLLGIEPNEFSISPKRHDLGSVRFVCTMDSDNVFSDGAILRMVEAMTHPNNRPIISKDGKRLEEGFALLAPQIVTGPLPSRSSLFECLATGSFRWANPREAGPDFLQDVLGEGCFHGKGIYDLKAFHSLTDGRFPLDMILSHDLLEGAACGVQVSNCIPIFERAPATIEENAARWHRWMRGDWQNLMWLCRILPRGGAPRAATERLCARGMNLLLAWRIVDNVRRNFVPVFLLAALITEWIAAKHPGRSTFLALFIWLAPSLLCLLVGTSGKILMRGGWKNISDVAWAWLFEALRSVFDFMFLPFFAAMAVHSAVVSSWRVCISGRKLLAWRPFAIDGSLRSCSVWLIATSLLSAISVCAASRFMEPAADTLRIFGGIWLIAPVVAWMSSRISIATGNPSNQIQAPHQ